MCPKAISSITRDQRGEFNLEIKSGGGGPQRSCRLLTKTMAIPAAESGGAADKDRISRSI
jgi:hypothetical protein